MRALQHTEKDVLDAIRVIGIRMKNRIHRQQQRGVITSAEEAVMKQLIDDTIGSHREHEKTFFESIRPVAPVSEPPVMKWMRENSKFDLSSVESSVRDYMKLNAPGDNAKACFDKSFTEQVFSDPVRKTENTPTLLIQR